MERALNEESPGVLLRAWPTSLKERVDSIVSVVDYLKFRVGFTPSSDAVEREPTTYRLGCPTTEAEVWGRSLRELSAVSGASGAAIVLHDPASGVVLEGPLSDSTRLRAVAARLYGDYLRTGAGAPGGIRDGSLHRGVFGEFAELGYRYIGAYPFSFCRGGLSRRGVAWLGFPHHYPPTDTEAGQLRDSVRRIEEDLRLLEAVREASARADDAERSSDRKSEFLAHISHDIRSPLHNVHAVLSLLRSETEGDGASELIDIAARNCEAAGELVDDILDFTRFREGRLPVRRERVCVPTVLGEVLQSFALTASKKGVTILSAEVDAPVDISIDRRHLRRIVANLVGNAVKYTQRGSIGVRVESDEARCSIAIRDSGVGMTASEVEQLFTPFQRFGDRSIEGIGLGLVVARALVEANGGSIEVSSTPHVGTLFTVTFPLTEQRSVECASIQKGSLPCGDRRVHPPTILLVDDDPDSCRSLARALSRYPVETVIATSVPEAIGIFNFAAPDIVVTDLGMPLGGGRKLVEYIRAKDRGVPIYAVSGEGDIERCLVAQVSGIFQKPIDVEKFACTLHREGCLKSDPPSVRTDEWAGRGE
jgi:signal transduction histidine kinase/ActR/RegA family two-component response regulator